MNYKDLIGDEVYCGSPFYEEFNVIKNVEVSGDSVHLHLINLNKIRQVVLEKQDLDKFVEQGYVEFMVKSEKGLALECLMSCHQMYVRSCEE